MNLIVKVAIKISQLQTHRGELELPKLTKKFIKTKSINRDKFKPDIPKK